MALVEELLLVSIELNLQGPSVNVAWANRILRDGEVISSTPHRGAYELVEGELPEYIRDELNVSMMGFAGEALTSFAKANAQLITDKNLLIDELTSLRDQLALANSKISELESAAAELSESLSDE